MSQPSESYREDNGASKGGIMTMNNKSRYLHIVLINFTFQLIELKLNYGLRFMTY